MQEWARLEVFAVTGGKDGVSDMTTNSKYLV
jgi:hypothetical protein